MEILTAIIEKSNDGGFSIHSKDIEGSYAMGLTELEAKEDFIDVIEEQAEYYKEIHGSYPDWYSKGYKVNYVYDLSAFFASFPFINASAFAKEIGINTSLMRRYKNRITFASEKQKELIQDKYNHILERMKDVTFA